MQQPRQSSKLQQQQRAMQQQRQSMQMSPPSNRNVGSSNNSNNNNNNMNLDHNGRRLSMSPDPLHQMILSPESMGSPSFGRNLLGSSTPNSLLMSGSGAGGGLTDSFSSFRSVLSQFQPNTSIPSTIDQNQVLPPPPPFGGSNKNNINRNTIRSSGNSTSTTTTGSKKKNSNLTNKTSTTMPSNGPAIQPNTSLLSLTGDSSHSKKSTKGTTSNNNYNNDNTALTANTTGINSTPPLPIDTAEQLLTQCDWVDKTLWVARQLLGGQSVNGFLRSTSTIQRIKRQRTRQTKLGKSTNTVEPTGANNNDTSAAAGAADFDEGLKRDIMNTKTAKRIKSELEEGIQFCRLVHNTICSIVKEMDPSLPIIEKLELPKRTKSKNNTIRNRTNSRHSTQYTNPSNTSTVDETTNNNNRRWSIDSSSATQQIGGGLLPLSSPIGPASVSRYDDSSNSIATTTGSGSNVGGSVSPGNPNGSTLRKNRKKKLPPNFEPPIDLPEYDNTGKRLCNKREHLIRLAECVRYRALRQGDVVAARVSSRNLWILARVLKDYPGPSISLLDFVRLQDTKREQLFKDKVIIKDFEVNQNDADSTFSVSRNLILPLPRSYAEAAEWGLRYKKGSRVYALYPTTTALYSATIIDSTTYARDDDDIMVVQFDGDEPDSSGTIPACHVPSRFVTLIPKGISGNSGTSNATVLTTGIATPQTTAPVAVPLEAFSSSSTTSNNNKGNKKKKGSTNRSTTPIIEIDADVPPAPNDDDFNMAGNLDELDLDDPLPGLDDFGDMDFDF